MINGKKLINTYQSLFCRKKLTSILIPRYLCFNLTKIDRIRDPVNDFIDMLVLYAARTSTWGSSSSLDSRERWCPHPRYSQRSPWCLLQMDGDNIKKLLIINYHLSLSETNNIFWYRKIGTGTGSYHIEHLTVFLLRYDTEPHN